MRFTILFAISVFWSSPLEENATVCGGNSYVSDILEPFVANMWRACHHAISVQSLPNVRFD